MFGSGSWPVLSAVLFWVAGTCFVLWMALRGRRGPNRRAEERVATDTTEMACTVCQKTLVFHRNQLFPLSPPEMALVVRSRPKCVGMALAEYVCPYCEAAHCFQVDGKQPELIGVNLYEPQKTSAHCFECQRPLRNPSWLPGQYGKLADVPQLLPEYGLVCPRCNSVCCVACCTNVTRNRTRDGSLLCPRCSRGPLETVFHF